MTETIDRPADDISHYYFWRQALAGERPAWPKDRLPAGFFRMKWNGKGGARFVPVAVWPEGDEMRVLMGTASRHWTPDKHDISGWIEIQSIGEPVAEAAYREAYQTGEWPDFAPARRGVNTPADAVEQIADQIDSVGRLLDEALAKAEAALEAGAGEKEAGDAVANLRDRLLELRKAAEAKQKEECEPHNSALREIRKRFGAITDKIEGWNRRARDLLTRVLRKAEAAKAQEIAQAVAAKTDPHIVRDMAPRVGGGSGRRVGMRTRKIAVIEDYPRLLEALKDHADVRATVEKLANASARNGIALPGMSIKEEREAA